VKTFYYTTNKNIRHSFYRYRRERLTRALYPRHHSKLFSLSHCVMLYSTAVVVQE